MHRHRHGNFQTLFGAGQRLAAEKLIEFGQEKVGKFQELDLMTTLIIVLMKPMLLQGLQPWHFLSGGAFQVRSSGRVAQRHLRRLHRFRCATRLAQRSHDSTLNLHSTRHSTAPLGASTARLRPSRGSTSSAISHYNFTKIIGADWLA